MKKTILIVCRGNIIRSPFAEVVLNNEIRRRGLEKQMFAISRSIQGTRIDPVPVKFPNISYYKEEYDLAKPIFEKLNIDLSNSVSKPVNKTDMNNASIVVAIDNKVKDQLGLLFPDFKTKIFKFSYLFNKKSGLADPEGKQNTGKVLTEINNAITKSFDAFLSRL